MHLGLPHEGSDQVQETQEANARDLALEKLRNWTLGSKRVHPVRQILLHRGARSRWLLACTTLAFNIFVIFNISTAEFEICPSEALACAK